MTNLDDKDGIDYNTHVGNEATVFIMQQQGYILINNNMHIY